MLGFSYTIMKNFAKLSIFFSISIAFFFFAAILLSSISSWINLSRLISAEAAVGANLADSAWIAISATLYFSILLTLGYSARTKMPIPLSIFCITLLACAFATGISLGVNRLGTISPVFRPVSPLQAGPGLMLSRSQNTIVLLRDSNQIRGPRLVSIPGQPLIYQEVPLGPNNTILSLPSLPFGNDTPCYRFSQFVYFINASFFAAQKGFMELFVFGLRFFVGIFRASHSI